MSNLTDQSVKLILDHVDNLAVKLGVGTGEIFSWYVKQIWIDFYVQLVWLSVIGIIFVGLIIFGRSCKNTEKKEHAKMSDARKKKLDEQTSLKEVVFIIAGIFGFIEAAIFVATLVGSIPKLLNINYHAFNDLISRLSSVL